MNGHLKRVLILLLIFTFVFQMAGVTSLSRVQAYADTETEEVLDITDADEAEDMTTEEIDTESPGEIETDGENPPDEASEPADPEAASEEPAEVPEETPAEETITVEEPVEEPAEEPAPTKAPVLKAATKAEKTGTVLAFTSDTHNGGRTGTSNDAANRLGTWIENVKSIHGGIDVMAFGGDMAGANASGYWDLTQADINMLTSKDVPGVYTTGNHEISAGGDFKYNTYTNGGYSSTETKGQFELDKEVAVGKDYRIYALGSRSDSQAYPEDQRKALDDYLTDAGNDKVIFIITHFPLHYYGSGYSRTTTGASEMIDLLNNAVTKNGQTIVFLWGHNHTLSDTYYDEIYGPGGNKTIEYAKGYSKEIEFYYGGAGCMSDTENGSPSAFVKGKGLVATITQNRGNATLGFTYYGLPSNNDVVDVTESTSIRSVAVTLGEAAGGDTGTTYTLTDKLEAGKEYLIATANSGSGYILSNESGSVSNSLKGYSVDVESNKITIDEEIEAKTLFTASGSDNNSIRLMMGGKYLYADGNGALRMVDSISDAGKFWHYKADDNGTDKRLLWFYNGTTGEYGYTATGSYKYYLECDADGNFTKGIADNNTALNSVNAPKIYLFTKDDGSGGDDPTPDDPPTGKTVDITPATTADEKSITIDVGETLAINVTNGSNREAYDFTATLENSGIAEIQGNSTVNIAAGETGQFVVKGLADGTVDINISNNNGNYARKGIIHLTVGEGGGDIPTPTEGDRYEEVTNLQDGKEYIIAVTKDAGSVYAINKSGSNSTNTVTLAVTAASGNSSAYIITDQSGVAWKYTASSKFFANGSEYLYPSSSSGVMAYSSGRAIDYADGKMSFSTSSSGTYYFTCTDGSFDTSNNSANAATFRIFEKVAEGGGDDPTPTTSSKYVLTSTLEAGGEYIIVNDATVGSTSSRALKNPGGTSSGVAISANNGKTTVTVQQGDYIETSDTDIVWTAEANGEGVNLKNNGDYLEQYYLNSSHQLVVFNSIKQSDRYWTYSDHNLKHNGGSSVYYINYTSGTFGVITTASNVYLFKKVTEEIPANSITVSPTSKTILVGEETQLTASVTPENATGTIVWNSSDETVASVTSGGKVTGIKVGTATITATIDGISATCTITVDPVPVSSVTLDKTTATVMETKTLQLNATVMPDNATNKDITWASSDSTIATVDQTGKVTGVKAGGAATITATAGGKSATCEVTVTEYVAPAGYVIVIEDHALSTDNFEGNLNTSTGYYYYGLTSIPYSENTEVTDNILWIIEETEGGYYIKSQDGKYLNATYGTVGSNTEGRLKLDNTPDVWTISGSFEDWMIDGSTLTSANAGKSLTNENGTLTAGGTGTLFTVRSTGETSTLVDPQHPIQVEICYVETDSLELDKKYIVAAENTETSVFAIKNNSGSIVSQELVVIPASGTEEAYIITDDDNVIWNYTKPSSTNYLINNSQRLYYDRNNNYVLTASSSGYAIAYNVNNHLSINSTRYVSYSNNQFTAQNNESSASRIRLFVETKKVIPSEHTHTYGEPTYEWSADNTSCTATAVCSGCEEGTDGHSVTETVTATYAVTTPATCTAVGSGTYTASFENELFAAQSKTVEIPKVAHTPGEAVHENEVAATCTATGRYDEVVYCSVCDEELSREAKTVSALGHHMIAHAAVAATCTEAGNSAYWSCDRCGKYFGDEAGNNEIEENSWNIPALGHDFGEWTVTTAPTCTEAGMETRTCSRCDASETRAVEALGHDLKAHAEVAATCTEAGNSAYWSCERCGKFFSDANGNTEIAANSWVIPAKDHDWGTPTYTWAEDNSKVTASRVCKNDATHVETEEVAATYEVVTEPTDTTSGTGRYISAAFVNEAFEVQTKVVEIPPTGYEVTYVWNETPEGYTVTGTADPIAEGVEPITETVAATYAVTKAATCTEAGIGTWTSAAFTNSQFAVQTKEVAIPATGHTMTHHAAVPATCTETGTVEYWSCSVCEKNFSDAAGTTALDTIVAPALGHTMTAHPVVEAKCETAGNSAYWSCSVCGKFFSDANGNTEIEEDSWVIDPIGHDWGAPTYTWADDHKVTATRICNNDHSHAQTEISTATYAVTTPATCSAEGLGTWTATFTNTAFTTQTKTEPIEKIAHTVVEDAAVAPTCTEPGRTAGSHCSVCNEVIVAQEEVPALGHDWEFVDFTWTGSDTAGYTAAVANYKCANDETHTNTASAAATSVTTAATCEEAGQIVYTAAIAAADSLDEAAHSDSKTVAIQALGHDWNDPTYAWAADNSTVTATRTCKHDASHMETETVSATYGIITPATEQEAGVGRYTSAAFTNTAFTVQTKDVEIPPTGFSVSYVWAEDFSSVTGTAVPYAQGAATITETVTPQYSVTTEATCTQAGTGTWTATFTKAPLTVQTKTVEIPVKDHTLTATAAKAATCTEAGNSAYWTCSECHKYFSDAEGTTEIEANSWIIPATGHTLVATAAKAATCTDAGNSAYWTCSECHKYFSDAEGKTEIEADSWIIPATEHTPQTVAGTPATCTEDGLTDGSVCSVCHETIVAQEVIPALGHSWNFPTYVWADDNSTVTATRTCKHDASHTETETVGTTYGVVTPATEQEAGLGRYTSAAFTNTAFTIQSKDVEIQPTGFVVSYVWAEDFSSVTGTAVPNAQGAATITETVTPQYSVKTAATCTEAGTGLWTATFTKSQFATQTKEVAIPAAGHTMTHHDAVPATCTEAGTVEYYSCSSCGRNFSDAAGANELTTIIDPAKGHDLTHHAAVAARCGVPGSIEYWQCETCGKLFGDAAGTQEKTASEIVVPALSHNFESAVTTAPTCEEEGVMTYTCTLCGESYTEAIPATGHDWGAAEYTWSADNSEVTAKRICANDATHVETETVSTTCEVTKQVTCTEDGAERYTSAEFKNKNFEVQKKETVIKAEGHKPGDPVHENEKEATCTAGGYYDEVVYCTVCKEELSRVHKTVEALGHDFSEWTVTKAPTCTEKGEEESTCSRCTAKNTRELAALGHSWDAGKVTKEPTYRTDGEMTYTCTVCGETYTEIIPKQGWKRDSDNNWNYINPDGTKATGWKKVGDYWYYMDAAGIMQTGWTKVGNKWYYMNKNGAMQTGWQKIGGKWYYFNKSGAMQTGWQDIDGKTYYFKSSGVMADKEWVTGYWWINAGGTWTYKYRASWEKTSDGHWMFKATNGWTAKSTTIIINDVSYTFDAKGYMQ